MIPAEKPREAQRKFVFVCFANNAIRLPIPVDSPAIAVSIKASSIL